MKYALIALAAMMVAGNAYGQCVGVPSPPPPWCSGGEGGTRPNPPGDGGNQTRPETTVGYAGVNPTAGISVQLPTLNQLRPVRTLGADSSGNSPLPLPGLASSGVRLP
jgi:hypothetical protein